MERVDDIATLLDIDLVKDYVSQIAPVPFKKTFYWGDQVKLEMQQKGYSIAEYPIFIGKSFEHLNQVYKLYQGTLDISTRGGSCKDVLMKNGVLIPVSRHRMKGFMRRVVEKRWKKLYNTNN